MLSTCCRLQMCTTDHLVAAALAPITAVAAAGMGVTISMPPEDDASSDSDARSDSDDEDYLLSESVVCAQPGLLLVELRLYQQWRQYSR